MKCNKCGQPMAEAEGEFFCVAPPCVFTEEVSVLKLVPEPIPLRSASLADIPTQLRKLADAYEQNPKVRPHVVLITREGDRPIEVFGLGAGTDTGLALAMTVRARTVLVDLLLSGSES
jgi:hypothetical protein